VADDADDATLHPAETEPVERGDESVRGDEDEHDDEEDLEPATLGELLDFIAREIVDDPDAVEVTETPDDRGVVLTLRVAPDDMGKVIGRGGRTAKAIRTVVKAAAIRSGVRHTHVDIAD
jgi:predicted RNA-binding protein YlqC (UPF0109 family)